MSIERIFYCNWRDCDVHIRTIIDKTPGTFITVTDGNGSHYHFCTWACLLKFAEEREVFISKFQKNIRKLF